MSREENKFPTRSYPYRYRAPPGAEGAEADVSADAIANMTLEAGRIYRFVLGLDPNPQPLSNEEADALLRDPFAQLLLRQGNFPLTLRELLAALDASNGTPEGLPHQKCFLVGDGGQIPWTPETAAVNRLLRFTVVRARDNDTQLMVSASTEIDSAEQFLQLIAWDSLNNAFNFYERRGGTWIWAGNSYHALMPGTRGQGPFDSHVNGSMVMKELRAPWNNWHSMNAHIREDVLAPGDPLRNEPLFVSRVPAHELEIGVLRPNIDRWNRARLKKAKSSDPQVLTDVHYFFRQVLETTTVNLVSSDQESRQIKADGKLVLPTTFFLNTEALLDHIGLDPQITPISVAGRFYIESLKKYEFALTDGDFSQQGDTFFAFLIPEPAFEDLNVLAILLQQKIISRRFAACLLMIDFPNPILSARRKQLMSYVPEKVRSIQAPGSRVLSDLETQFIAALQAKADLVAVDPEQEFLTNWSLPEGEWKGVFEQRIENYFGNLLQKAKTEEGFDGWIRLAESRRREFRRRALGEFRLTVPTTNIPLDTPALMMSDEGSVRAVS